MNVLKRFYIYQNERFPIAILTFTTLAVVLSSAAILSYRIEIHQFVLNFFACLAFLYHIRVIDEHRDYDHDVKYHPDRPVQRGLITLRELFYFNIPGLILFIFTSVFYGYTTIVYGGALIVFSFLAWKDFLIGNWLRKRFYLYNAVNMLQMVLVQMFIYCVFTQSFNVTKVMWIHLVFVIFNTIIMEFVRKIKTSSDESEGKDTYSWYLGYKRSLYIFYVFSIINFLVFIWMLYTIAPDILLYALIASGLLLFLTISVYAHLIKKKKASENILLLSTVVNYVGLNLLIYIFNLVVIK